METADWDLVTACSGYTGEVQNLGGLLPTNIIDYNAYACGDSRVNFLLWISTKLVARGYNLNDTLSRLGFPLAAVNRKFAY